MLKCKKAITALVVSIGVAHGAAHAGRTLECEADIPASVHDVWNAFATADGFMSWAVAKAEVDLRVGGEMRTSYNPTSDLHDEHTIVNKILAYEPERMLAIQNVQAPKGFANAAMFQQTWSVIYFEPTSAHTTHLRLIGMGYGEGPEWDAIYNFFKVGDAATLEELRRKFASAQENDGATASGSPAALDVLGRLVGGEWIHDGHAPDDSVFRVRNVLTKGADGVSLVGHAWLGDENGMYDHGTTIVYRAPGTQDVRFLNVNEEGAVSTGDIRAVGPYTIAWNWHLSSLEGQQRAFRVTMTFTDDDHYTFDLKRKGDAGEWTPMTNVAFERVTELPAVFRKMNAAPAQEK